MDNGKQNYIRNFCIIAHIDHGKSTLADRLIEITGTLTKREMEEQVLDNMELEKERGITIKSQAVRLIYNSPVDNNEYILNLIDTPGHVDFNYEVSRSLAACEGALLVVDASQGVQAQTLANCYLASDSGLEVVPVLNKVDLPNQRTEEVRMEIEEVIGIEADDAPAISAKTGLNIQDVLEAVVRKIPKPTGDVNSPLKALVFDSMYDSYKGVICYIRVKEGYMKAGMKIKFMSSNRDYEVTEVGIFTPNYKQIDTLQAGEVGYVVASIKNVKDARVGDTITSVENPAEEPLEGYKAVVPTVFSGIYPIIGDKYEELKEALEKLQLNDASLIFEPETSLALGFGFRCGFLGLLHMEIIQERLEREFNLDVIITAPSVIYRINKTSGDIVEVTNPYNMPKTTEIQSTEEPIVNATIITPSEFVGGVMELCQGKRANFIDMQYLDTSRVILKYIIPLNEIIYDFFDTLKSKTKGYASFDYELNGYQQTKLVKLDILLNGDPIDALSMIVPHEKAYYRGKAIVEKLKGVIPRQLFEIPIQAAIGSKIIARETVRAVRKDVLAKCYGGDISRKKKLLEKQKEGKKRMKQVGCVDIPQEAFMSVLKVD